MTHPTSDSPILTADSQSSFEMNLNLASEAGPVLTEFKGVGTNGEDWSRDQIRIAADRRRGWAEGRRRFSLLLLPHLYSAQQFSVLVPLPLCPAALHSLLYLRLSFSLHQYGVARGPHKGY
eukprot:766462-Hanusia_phi.AAC.3